VHDPGLGIVIVLLWHNIPITILNRFPWRLQFPDVVGQLGTAPPVAGL
jgi:hypothetical protein